MSFLAVVGLYHFLGVGTQVCISKPLAGTNPPSRTSWALAALFGGGHGSSSLYMVQVYIGNIQSRDSVIGSFQGLGGNNFVGAGVGE